jgi:ArsR family transcriptional regulator
MSEDFSRIMDVLGNNVRRKILRKLSEGPDYVLRISQELQIGQQLIAKHVKVLEDAGFVHPVWEKSNRGARKKLYSIDKFYSVRIDFSPFLYNESLLLFDDEKEWIESSEKYDAFEVRLKSIMESLKGTDQLNPLQFIISEIDVELEEMERRRAKLLYLRNMVKRGTSESMGDIDRRERQLLHHIIERGPSSVGELSEGLLIREDSVRGLIRELIEKDLVNEKNKKIELQV